MIDEKKLLDILYDLSGEEDGAITLTSIKHIYDMIKELCSVCGCWTPVSEGLPQEGQKVIVTENWLEKNNVCSAVFYAGSDFWRDHVTAWMPFPEAYKEEDDGRICGK